MSSKSKFKKGKPRIHKQALQTIQHMQQKIEVARAAIQILVQHLDFSAYESRLPDGPYTIEDALLGDVLWFEKSSPTLANDDHNRS